MAAESVSRPSIWVLKGVRAGDTAQAVDLALQLGGKVEGKQLAFNVSHTIPNWLLGARVSHLTKEALHPLRPPWPDLVVATGRRTAPVALWIKQQSGGKTKLVQIGRPRMALSHFDLVLATPQYGLAEADNVVVMPVPFVNSKTVAEDHVKFFQEAWSQLPRPWVLGVIGGGKFPVVMDKDALAGFGQALQEFSAKRNGSIILLDSPRSQPAALATVAKQLSSPHWMFKRGQGPNPYQPALKLCDELCVTSDSVSMVSEMLDTAKPTWIFKLATTPLAIKWSAKNGITAGLARSGVFHPPRDVEGFMQKLIQQGFVGDLVSAVAPQKVFVADDVRRAVINRVLALLKP